MFDVFSKHQFRWLTCHIPLATWHTMGLCLPDQRRCCWGRSTWVGCQSIISLFWEWESWKEDSRDRGTIGTELRKWLKQRKKSNKTCCWSPQRWPRFYPSQVPLFISSFYTVNISVSHYEIPSFLLWLA